MTSPYRSGFIPAEVVHELPDVVAGSILEEQRSAEERATREETDRRSDAQIIADEHAKKVAQLRDFERRLDDLDLCDHCGKTRSLANAPSRFRDRFDRGVASPQTHCACPGGVVPNADAWEVEFARGYRDAAVAVLRPASRAFGPLQLQPLIAPSDTEPVGPSRFIPAERAFEWAEESPACRRLAYTMLALVTNTTVADRWAEAYMREVLATTIAKNAGRKQAQTIGEIRGWLASHEAASGAAA